jgi:hypothetical protein
LFLIFEAASISLFPRNENIIPVLGERGGIREGEVDEIPDLGREMTFEKEMGDGFRC